MGDSCEELFLVPDESRTVLRVVDLEGKQVPDIVCFNAHDAASQHLNKQLQLAQWAVVYS